MDKRIQKNKKVNEGNRRSSGANNKSSQRKKASRKPKEQEKGIKNLGDLISVLHHFCPYFNKWLKEIQDFRREDRIIYSAGQLIYEVILSLLSGNDSRNSLTLNKGNEAFKANVETLSNEEMEYLPHGDTVDYFFQNLNPEELEKLIAKSLHSLHKKKVLNKFRYQNHYLLAIDGVHIKTSKKPMPNSIKIEHKDGRVEYRLYVLEAKLVSPEGAVFSLASTFIGEDDLPDATLVETDADGKITKYPKQDSELKAFSRLIEKIKTLYPKWKFCVLLDGLYLTQNVITSLRVNGWYFSITFKEGSAPKLYKNIQEVLDENTENQIKNKNGTTLQWKNFLIWENGDKKISLNVIGTKKANNKDWAFLYVTNMHINKENAKELQDEVCRMRWKIENQGFNEQKNCGLGLEKVFGTRKHAAQNHYLIVQLAHMVRVLIIHSNMFRVLQRIDNKKIIKKTIQKPMLKFFKTIKHFVKEFYRSIFSFKLTLRNDEFERLEFAVHYS
jgi:hypothetical protein